MNVILISDVHETSSELIDANCHYIDQLLNAHALSATFRYIKVFIKFLIEKIAKHMFMFPINIALKFIMSLKTYFKQKFTFKQN